MRAQLRPNATSCANELEARDARPARRPGLSGTAWRRRFSGRAGMNTGEVCGARRPRRRFGGDAQGSGWREGPRRIDGDARIPTSELRTDSAPFPPTLSLHRTYRSRVERGTATSLEGRSLASATEATNNVARSLLKNLAPESNTNAWPPLAGCLLQVFCRSPRGRPARLAMPSETATTLQPFRGRPHRTCPASCGARAA